MVQGYVPLLGCGNHDRLETTSGVENIPVGAEPEVQAHPRYEIRDCDASRPRGRGGIIETRPGGVLITIITAISYIIITK